MRPILRFQVDRPDEAVFREDTANQRWYRDFSRPLSVWTGGALFLSDVLIRIQRRNTWFVFLAAALYSIGGLCIKVIPWNGMSINSGRNMIAIVVVGIYLLLSRHKLRLNRWIALGAICVCGTNVLFSLANKMTTAANTIVLQFTAPVFVILLSFIFRKEKPKRLDLIACAAVFVGVLFFFLDGLSVGGMVGNILALISGLTYAGVFMLNEFPDADPICSVFWGDVISVLIGLPFIVKETDFTLVPIVSIVILGVFQVGLAYVLMCIGLRTTPPVTASLISGIEPILNPILVAVFYKESIGQMALIAAAIVISAVVWYNVQKGRSDSPNNVD